MSTAEKFLFDNFVINEDNIVEKDDNKIFSDSDYELNEFETVSNENVADDYNTNEELEVVVEEVKAEEEIVVDPNDVPTYSQNQLDEMLLNSRNDGYNKAIEEQKNAQADKTQSMMMEMGNKLSMIFAKESENNEEALLNNLSITKAIVKKLLPSIAKKDAHLEIEEFIKNNYKDFYQEKTLNFHVNPENLDLIKENLVKLSKDFNFENKYQIFPEANIEITDCRIEWETGGIEKNTNDIWKQIDQLIS